MNQLIIISSLTLCGVICFLVSRDPYILISILYSITFYKVDETKKIKRVCYFCVCFFVITILMSILGILEMNRETIYTGFYFILPEKISLGFVTANYTFIVFNLILLLYGLYRKKFKLLEKVVFLFISFALFCITVSRTGFIMSVLIVLFFNFISENRLKITNYRCLIVFLFVLASFIMAENFFNIGYYLNSALNERPMMWNYYITKGITFFGIKPENYLYIDNFYLFLFCFNGLFSFLFFVVPFFIMISSKKNRHELITCLVFICFYFIFENCFKVFIPFISCLIANYCYKQE